MRQEQQRDLNAAILWLKPKFLVLVLFLARVTEITLVFNTVLLNQNFVKVLFFC